MNNKHDPMQMFRSAKNAKVVTPAEDKQKVIKYEESELHLKFCKWVKKNYPNVDFIRNERERKRNALGAGAIMAVYNSIAGMPDFECLDSNQYLKGLYFEFKKPGESWLNKHGQVKPAYAHQYACHLKLWRKGRAAYFVNDLQIALDIFTAYMNDQVLAKQQYDFTDEDKKKYLVDTQ